MCDTLYKRFDDGSSVFMKNSDRSPNEPNLVLSIPSRKASSAPLKCTYIEIPDEDAYALLLVKPSWIWGGEMGINENGVSIGNEAVWTHSLGKSRKRLLGMDLLRLGLERSKDAKEALEVIIGLLEEYGQGGNAGFDKKFVYDNSFLIADGKTAYILETAGKEWAYSQISEGNISNRLSLKASDRSSQDGNFISRHADVLFNFFSGSKARKALGCQGLKNIGSLKEDDCFALLKSHEKGKEDDDLFTHGSLKSLCMHAGGIGDQTTGSLVVFYRDGKPEIWTSGSSTPCLSIYKPVLFNNPYPPLFADTQKSFEYWMKREKVIRAVFAGLIDASYFRKEEDDLQQSFIEDYKPTKEYVRYCSDREDDFFSSYKPEVLKLADNPSLLPPFWQKQQKTLGKEVFGLNYKARK